MKEVKMVVEGVYSAKAARILAMKYQVEMPIVEQINEVLFEGKSAAGLSRYYDQERGAAAGHIGRAEPALRAVWGKQK
jgi:glycerol-3-phosphate dehydrogenase